MSKINRIQDYIERNKTIIGTKHRDSQRHFYEVLDSWNDIFEQALNIKDTTEEIDELGRSSDFYNYYGEIRLLNQIKKEQEQELIDLVMGIYNWINSLQDKD